MKLVIPNEFQVGAHKIRIRWNEVALKVAGLRGQSDYKEQIVRLMPGRTDTQTFETLVHEMFHFVDTFYNLGTDDDKEEERLETRCQGITQAFLSLGIEPDFSQLIEE